MTALQLGSHRIATPVVLAPMAGITNTAFRRLCREQMAAEGGQGLFVSEMVTSRALIERNDESMRLIQHDPDESPRSVQLYGVDPATVGACVSMLLDEGRADHIDLNFGCPVQKVTRKGGGAALPWKAGLFAAIVSAAVKAATPYDVPVTVKMRKGIDADHLSYLDAGRIAEAEASPTWRCTVAPPPSTTPVRPTGRPSPTSSSTSPASRCSATATSGRPTTRSG